MLFEFSQGIFWGLGTFIIVALYFSGFDDRMLDPEGPQMTRLMIVIIILGPHH